MTDVPVSAGSEASSKIFEWGRKVRALQKISVVTGYGGIRTRDILKKIDKRKMAKMEIVG